MGIIGGLKGDLFYMGRKVLNTYESGANNEVTWLTVASPGYYTAKAKINTVFDEVPLLESIKKYVWCYEQSKGQIYTMDLSRKLPTSMGYATPRVYLRDYILFLLGHNPRTIEWRRDSISDYTIRPCDLFPRKKRY
jgi:hypothetical protein